MLKIGEQVPDVEFEIFHNNEIKKVNLNSDFCENPYSQNDGI